MMFVKTKKSDQKRVQWFGKYISVEYLCIVTIKRTGQS